MLIIQEWGQKIKLALDEVLSEWGIAFLALLLAISSFGLGRLSAFESVKPPVSIIQAPTLSHPLALAIGGLVVGSDSGVVYYFPWCASAQDIPANKQVWFKDEAGAQKAGYKPAKACKGLIEVDAGK